MIEDSRYNEAILALASYIDRYPEKFDTAQARMRRILRTRDSYNAKAQDLLNLIENEPENDAKALGMIGDLEKLEKNPTERTQQFLRETKATAQFTFYRSMFERIMREGQALIDRGSYQNALSKYAEGFVIYRDEFETDYDPALVRRVNELLRKNAANTAAFTRLSTELQLAHDNVKTMAVTGSDSALSAALARYSAVYNDFMAVRNDVASCGWSFEKMFADVLKDRMFATETSFLPFAYRFVLGRGTANRLEGQAGVFDVYAYKTQDDVLAAVYDRFDRLWLASAGSLDSRTAYEHTTSWRQCSAAADSIITVCKLYDATVKSPKGTVAPSGFTGHGIREERNKELARYDNVKQLAAQVIRSTESIAAVSTAVSGTNATTPDITAAAVRNDAVTQTAPILERAKVLINARKDIVAYLASAQTLSEKQRGTESLQGALSSDNTTETTKTAETGDNTTIPPVADSRALDFSAFESYLAHFIDTADVGTLASYRSVIALYNSGSGKIADELESRFANDRKLADGIAENTGATADGVPAATSQTVFYYPEECLAAMNRLASSIASDRRAVQAVYNRTRSVPQSVETHQLYIEDSAELQSYLDRINALSTQVAAYQERTAESVRLATRARQEAERALADARRALNSDNFDRARSLMERATERYTEMLGIQNSSSQRKKIDETLLSLGNEITRKENDAVVRDVRNYLTKAKNAYFSGDFITAEDTLAAAEARWAVTNGAVANGEITHWKGIVNTALSLKTGRTIPVSAPLYPDMSQLLSLANQYYTQGSEAMRKGDRENARALLENARRKLDEVKMVYPLNQEASLLTLRIDRVIDPAAFDSLFQRRYEEAMKNYKNPEKQQEAYSDLLDLSEINPQNKKLQRDIYTVELYLGIKIPPPNPADLRRSKTLTAEARAVVNANNRTMFSVALAQLDKAISLDANNTDAVLLKDRLQTMIGGEAVVALSTADEAKYQIAVSELQKGNTIVAASYVQQLLNNPRNKNSTKIRELEDRIKARL